MAIGCRIRKDFVRPDKKLVEAFRGLPVANIDDCMNRTAALRHDIHPINKAPLLGTAFTVKVAEGDNLFFHKAMDMAQPGDVFMIDAGGDPNRSIFGEIMVRYCAKRGIAGIVVDGSIRDSDSISQMDFPVYAKGVTPNGPYKNGPGEIGGAVTVGGIIVHPGDIVVGDADGVIVIPPEEAEALAEKVRAFNENEAVTMERIAREGAMPRPWVEQKMEALGVEYVD